MELRRRGRFGVFGWRLYFFIIFWNSFGSDQTQMLPVLGMCSGLTNKLLDDVYLSETIKNFVSEDFVNLLDVQYYSMATAD